MAVRHTVPVMGIEVTVLVSKEGSFVAPADLIRGLGLSAGNELTRIDDNASVYRPTYIPGWEGESLKMLPLDRLHAWLASIDSGRVHPMKRTLLAALQSGALDTLKQALDAKDTKPVDRGLMTVDFHGASLVLVEKDGQPYVAMKSVVEGMGLDWEGQRQKIQRDQARWGTCVMQAPSESGEQITLFVPLRKLPGWFGTVHASRIKDAVLREKIRIFQNECDDALWAYWTKGHAMNPRAASDPALIESAIRELRETLQVVASARNEITALSEAAKHAEHRAKKAEGKLDEQREMKEKRLMGALIARVIKDPVQRHQALHAILPSVIPAPRAQAASQPALPGLEG